MRTGAELAALQGAAAGLEGVATALGDQVPSVDRALRGIASSSGLSAASGPAERAAGALGSLLQELDDAAARLGRDAAEQHHLFTRAACP